MKVLVYTSHYEKFRSFLWDEVGKYREIADIYVFNDKKPISDIVDYDIGISFMYNYKVPKEELKKATWFNFHPAPLPEYKGRNLCYRALLNGEKEFGATLHYMDENFDTGDIIHVERFPIGQRYTAEDLSNHALDVSKILFTRYLPRILAEEDFLRYPNRHTIYYPKEPINDQIELPPHIKNRIRAITYKEHYPKVNIGGVMYKIVKE